MERLVRKGRPSKKTSDIIYNPVEGQLPDKIIWMMNKTSSIIEYKKKMLQYKVSK